MVFLWFILAIVSYAAIGTLLFRLFESKANDKEGLTVASAFWPVTYPAWGAVEFLAWLINAVYTFKLPKFRLPKRSPSLFKGVPSPTYLVASLVAQKMVANPSNLNEWNDTFSMLSAGIRVGFTHFGGVELLEVNGKEIPINRNSPEDKLLTDAYRKATKLNAERKKENLRIEAEKTAVDALEHLMGSTAGVPLDTTTVLSPIEKCEFSCCKDKD